ncbi:MAG: hypothetical protein JST80_03975 [Bdellovibrionales bacterium]|nr:hypothetical protein [Bdellovibrionales bacterium]
MKSSFLLGLILLSLTPSAQAGWFGDFYFEGNYLGRSDNYVGFGHLRVGEKFNDLEIYGAVRGSHDTRSDSSPLGQVYNDNFIFAGVGADYVLPFSRGFRLRGQIGSSFNLLNPSSQKEGPVFEAGLLSWHEGSLGSSDFGFENYGEAFYIHRYENMIMSDQFRVMYKRFEGRSGSYALGAYPIAMGVIGFDTNEIFYNRFVDVRGGVRFQARKQSIVFSITPEYVVGKYIGQNTASYNEFRLLAVIYAEIF